MKRKIVAALLSLTMLGNVSSQFAMTASAASPIVAFPGAEGAGKYATGGRGGTVYHVTNLNDSGAGSFRDAVSHTGRIIVFDVGGTINLKSDVVVKGNNTIAGQTAPGGGGITLRGGKIGMGGDNIIIRFVSSRPGENGSSECDAWGGDKGSNSIIDHCSIGWANDEQFGLYSSMQQTVQYSIIGPSNCISYHSKGAHGFGIMMGAGHNTWHHNMIAHNISRNFRGKISGKNTLDYVNNVIFNWGYQTAYGTFGQVNYVGNYFKKGLSTNGGHRYISINSGTAPENYRFYLVGNKMVNSDGTDYNTAMNTDNWQGVDYGSAGLTQSNYQVTSPLRVNDVNGNDSSIAMNAQTADQAFETVLAYSGAGISADLRPKIDRQVMEEARTGNGYLTGGRDFSTLTSSDTALNEAIAKYNIKQMNYDDYYPQAITQKEIVDTDNDGMPDEWELARGLNPNSNDANGDYLSQGYNNIEYYINDLTVNAFPKGVVTVSPETVELGEEYINAKADADALMLSPTTIEKVSDLTLPTKGAKGSDIQWSSSSSAIVITNNKISAVNRPTVGDASVTLTASIINGKFKLNRIFTITVRQIPYSFDFGNGNVQSGYTAVTPTTVYSQETGYGFTGSSQSGIANTPRDIPSGKENLYSDQIEGNTKFRANVPNGRYTVVVHYGVSDTSYGTRYNVEGADSGALASGSASEYVVTVDVKDGVLDIDISAGDKNKGGYISGLDIVQAPTPKYKFDFGDGAVQSDFTAVPASTAYSYATGYGFVGTLPSAMERAPGNIPSGYENLHADQINGVTQFKADVPNGKYIVTIHYGSWNTSFGTNYTVEGVSSGNLTATEATRYVTEVEITDGVLDVAINKGSQSYGGYINGIDIMPMPTLPYHFDFGDDAVQDGYTAVTSSTIYSENTEYGFDGVALGGMSRAPGGIKEGFENLYNDQLNGEGTFKTIVPNGTYEVVIHYGSWNTSFGTNYTVEGVSSGNLAATEATQYRTTVKVTDGMLDLNIAKGSKSYGGYISGMDVIPVSSESTPTPTPTTKPTPTPTPTPTQSYKINISYEKSDNGFVVTGTYTYPKNPDDELMAVLAVYDESGILAGIKMESVTSDMSQPVDITGIAANEGYIIKGMLWKKDSLLPMTDLVSIDIKTSDL